MSTSNPFQIPTCFQRADIHQRRRNRLKKIMVGTVAFFVVLLIVLLIEGCMSEHARVSNPAKPAASETIKPQPVNAITPSAPPPAPLMKTPAPASTAAALQTYLVKPGDTLSRIAQVHHLTVRAIKTANDLEDDGITAGMVLKLLNV